MGYNEITNLLGKLDKDEIPKFTTIKYIEIFDQSNGTYNKNKDIRFKTNQLRNDLNDFNYAYVVVTSDLKFSIADCKLYVPVVTLQTQYQNQLYKELKAGISIDFK